MPRKFFTQLSRRYKQNQDHPWYLKPFDYVLAHPAYFSATRRSVSSGLWLGIFIGLLPIPGQTPLAILGAIALRVNVPLAAISVWITNPITFVPIFYLAERLGAAVLGIPSEPFPDQITVEWISSELAQRWKPLLYGSLIVASSVASTVYVLINLVWQTMTRKRYRLRRTNRRWPQRSSDSTSDAD